jgi:hypothetical protein
MRRRALIAAWKSGDQGMAKLAEVIASAFASGMTWAADAAGHPVYCPPPGAPLAGDRLMHLLEQWLS